MKRGQASSIRARLPKLGLHLSKLLTKHVDPLIRAAKLISHLFQRGGGDVELFTRFDTNAHITNPTLLKRIGWQNQ